MPKLHVLQTNWLGGQVDAEAEARAETAVYRNGARQLLNCWPLAAGGVRTRPGTRHHATLDPEDGAVRLVPFVFSEEQAYVGAFIEDGVVWRHAADGAPAGQINTAPWTAEMLAALRFEQAGDTMWVTHADMETQVIRRTGEDTWTLSTISYDAVRARPFYRYAAASVTAWQRVAADTLHIPEPMQAITTGTVIYVRHQGAQHEAEATITGVSGSNYSISWTSWAGLGAGALGWVRTIVSGSMADVGGCDGQHSTDGSQIEVSTATWAGGHLNRAIRVWDDVAKVYRHGLITQVVSTTRVKVSWENPSGPPLEDATTLWEEEAFSVARGFVRSVCLHQQRLWFGGGRDCGDALWASRPHRYWSFELGDATDDYAIAARVSATEANAIKHLVSANALIALTATSAFYVVQSQTKPITPTTFQVRQVGRWGSGDVTPGVFDGGVLVTQANGTLVRDIHFGAADEEPTSDPVSLPVTDSLGIVRDAAFLNAPVSRPEQLAFFVTDDGRIMVFHSLRAQKVGGWLEWTTEGTFTAVCVAGSSIFATVVRDGTVRLERFVDNLCLDAVVLDTLPLVASTLAGLTVHVCAVNEYFGSAEAGSDGAVTLQCMEQENPPIAEDRQVQIGLAFDWWIDPLPPSTDIADGSILRRPQRLLRTHLALLEAHSVRMQGDRFILLPGDFVSGDGVIPRTRWWRFTHLGHARVQNNDEGDAGATFRITREVPLALGVRAMKREVLVP